MVENPFTATLRKSKNMEEKKMAKDKNAVRYDAEGRAS